MCHGAPEILPPQKIARKQIFLECVKIVLKGHRKILRRRAIAKLPSHIIRHCFYSYLYIGCKPTHFIWITHYSVASILSLAYNSLHGQSYPFSLFPFFIHNIIRSMAGVYRASCRKCGWVNNSLQEHPEHKFWYNARRAQIFGAKNQTTTDPATHWNVVSWHRCSTDSHATDVYISSMVSSPAVTVAEKKSLI